MGTPAAAGSDLEAAEAELKAISESGAEVSCQFVNEQTICSVVEEVHIPDLGPDKDVDVIDVMVSVGDHVEADDGLLTLETDKASMDVPAPFGGEIIEFSINVGDKANSGDLVCKIVKTVVMENKVPTPAATPAPEPAKKAEPAKPANTLQAAVATASAVVEKTESSVLSKKAKKVYASP